MNEHEILPGDRVAPGSVSATRIGTRTFVGHNARGAAVRIGPVEVADAFTPGELLKLALTACAGMSADQVIARRLGDDFEATYWAHGVSAERENRYHAVDEEAVIPGFDTLDAAEQQKLLGLIARAIDRGCTVGRSVRDSIDVSTTVNGTPLPH